MNSVKRFKSGRRVLKYKKSVASGIALDANAVAKRCNRCGKLVDVDLFPLATKYNTNSVDGMYHLCKRCCIVQDLSSSEAVDRHIRRIYPNEFKSIKVKKRVLNVLSIDSQDILDIVLKHADKTPVDLTLGELEFVEE